MKGGKTATVAFVPTVSVAPEAIPPANSTELELSVFIFQLPATNGFLIKLS
jgi:hypothetical protein